MLRVVVRKVKHDEVDRLRAWMAELTRRADEVRETFAQETVRHETALLIEGPDGPPLIYAMEAADHDVAAAASAASELPIDREHRDVMNQVLGEAAPAEVLFDLHAPS